MANPPQITASMARVTVADLASCRKTSLDEIFLVAFGIPPPGLLRAASIRLDRGARPNRKFWL